MVTTSAITSFPTSSGYEFMKSSTEGQSFPYESFFSFQVGHGLTRAWGSSDLDEVAIENIDRDAWTREQQNETHCYDILYVKSGSLCSFNNPEESLLMISILNTKLFK